MANAIPPPQYPLLRDHIEGILTEGKVHSRRTGEWAKVEAYWHVGDALTGHFRDHPRAEYGQQTVRNLSQDLNLSESLLWDILLFRRSLPILYSSRELGWTHVRAVLRLPGQPDPEIVRQQGRYLNRELLDRRLARRYVR